MSTKTLPAPKRTASKVANRQKVTKTTIADFRKKLHQIVSKIGEEDQNMSIDQFLSEDNGRFVLATLIDGTYISLHVDINQED